MHLRFSVVLAGSIMLSGCFLDRAGVSFEDGGSLGTDSAATDMDASSSPDPDASRVDAGPAPEDGGGCAAGTVDLDLDPTNGCECTVSDEICDVAGVDENCNGVANEECLCVGEETQTCMMMSCEGVETCAAGAWGSCVVVTLVAESCNGLDDDCNGDIDDGAGDCATPSGCDVVRNAFGTYLFCHATRTGYEGSRDRCAMFGYHLVTIDDERENTMLAEEAERRRSGEWWIGIQDQDGDGTFAWVGPPSAFENFESSTSPGDCGLIASTDADWDAKGCGGAKSYICEAPAP